MCLYIYESRFGRSICHSHSWRPRRPRRPQVHVRSHTRRLRIKVKRAVCIAGSMVLLICVPPDHPFSTQVGQGHAVVVGEISARRRCVCAKGFAPLSLERGRVSAKEAHSCTPLKELRARFQTVSYDYWCTKPCRATSKPFKMSSENIARPNGSVVRDELWRVDGDGVVNRMIETDPELSIG